ncbi:hypothetical protein L2E82_07987 [Cichorium intybus]|uniref:Uncharacterized protein n=1 Tax=Cichorium intybus TaxID=13427 RepID=A0ACB9G688_CICIN|nr:hypothetical protein L2E82_07987 [Cichorium intybus]
MKTCGSEGFKLVVRLRTGEGGRRKVSSRWRRCDSGVNRSPVVAVVNGAWSGFAGEIEEEEGRRRVRGVGKIARRREREQ